MESGSGHTFTFTLLRLQALHGSRDDLETTYDEMLFAKSYTSRVQDFTTEQL